MNLHVSVLDSHKRSKDFHARIAAIHAHRTFRGIDPGPHWPGMWMWDLVVMQKREPRRSVPIQKVISLVCKQYKLSELELVSSFRDKQTVHARHIVCYLARKLCTRNSFPAIGKRLNRDHTVVLYAYRKVMARMEADKAFAGEIGRLMGALE